MTTCDIFVAHPLRHHFTNTLSGVTKSGLSFRVAVPLRLSSEILDRLPVMRKHKTTLANYCFPQIEGRYFINSPLLWLSGISRFFSANITCRLFDIACARMLLSGRVRPRFVHIYQDIMPETVRAAKKMGCVIVTEQILNASESVREQAMKMLFEFGLKKGNVDFGEKTESKNDYVLSVSSVAICPSQFVIEGIKDRFSGLIAHIPYGVSLLEFKPLPKPVMDVECTIAVRASGLRKAQPVAIAGLARAAKILRERGWDGILTIAFIGPLDETILAGEDWDILKSMPRINVTHGRLDRSEVKLLLGKAHIFLMPSLAEGMSLVVREAAASGLSLIISKNCGQDDFVNERHGILLDEVSVNEVSSALIKVISNPDFATRTGANAIELAQGRDWACFEDELADLYIKISREMK